MWQNNGKKYSLLFSTEVLTVGTYCKLCTYGRYTSDNLDFVKQYYEREGLLQYFF